MRPVLLAAAPRSAAEEEPERPRVRGVRRFSRQLRGRLQPGRRDRALRGLRAAGAGLFRDVRARDSNSTARRRVAQHEEAARAGQREGGARPDTPFAPPRQTSFLRPARRRRRRARRRASTTGSSLSRSPTPSTPGRAPPRSGASPPTGRSPRSKRASRRTPAAETTPSPITRSRPGSGARRPRPRAAAASARTPRRRRRRRPRRRS